jgi:hypothetical protein
VQLRNDTNKMASQTISTSANQQVRSPQRSAVSYRWIDVSSSLGGRRSNGDYDAKIGRLLAKVWPLGSLLSPG